MHCKIIAITKKSAGVNGFGRFGLHLLKYWLDQKDGLAYEIKQINDDTIPIEQAYEHILEDEYVDFCGYDVSIEDGTYLKFRDSHDRTTTIEYTHAHINEIPWQGIPELMLECSGKLTDAEKATQVISGKTQHVLIGATSWNADQTLVYGFNHADYDSMSRTISYGSCTVNAYVPLAQFIDQEFGVLTSDVHCIHNIPAYKVPENNTLNRKFCTLEKMGPRLLPFIHDNNFVVNYTLIPYTGVSMLDMRFELKNVRSFEYTVEKLQGAFNEHLRGLYKIAAADNGPEEYICTPYSAVFIKERSRLVGKNLYLFGYFDNENSVNRYSDLINYISLSF